MSETTPARTIPNPGGLTDEEVAQRIAAGQTNKAPNPNSRSLGSIIRENTVTSFNIVIGTLWALMIAARAPFQDSLFGFVIIFNSAIGIIQEYRAKRTLEKLSLIGEAKPIVRRNGADVEVSADDIVLDDLVVLNTGDQIVVDGEVLSGSGLEADESLLTGEADPVHKHVGDEVMSGSFVVAGSGVMRATKVGLDSYATKLTAEAKTFSTTKSELMGSIMRFVRTITWVLIPLGTLLFISQLRSAPTWQEALSGTVAGVVTMVPEGLVLLTSVAMAVAVVRLGQKRALVQEMPAVEVLARVDVVCVDKTGTLTEPGMAVNQLVVVDSRPAITNRSRCWVRSVHQRTHLTRRWQRSLTSTRRPVGRSLSSVPFSSARKWSAAAFVDHGSWLLGAPEVLLAAESGPEVDAVRKQGGRTGGRRSASSAARAIHG
ncbi:MAG: HAD-IC family P-type ATPase [Candidatus Nanopelagicales bacterium]